jgi:hypothetical protein
MKYIISESQHELLSESSLMDRLKRRVNKESFERYILETQAEWPTLCDDFVDEYEYSDNIIAMSIEHFFTVNEDDFTEGSYEEFIDIIFIMCRKWYGDDLIETYLSACGDDNMMNEAVEIDMDSRVIVKLFKFIDLKKKTAKNRKEILNLIKEYAPFFGVPEGSESYILELYLLNYRGDGNYSGLTKETFIDPKDQRGQKTANYDAGDYTRAKLPFKGSNLEGYWTKDRNGVKYYVVKSYGWYPVYIFKEGKWYENFDRYSNSTSKQMLKSRPYTYNNKIDAKVYLMSKEEMQLLERGVSHEDVMKKKKESFRDVKPSSRISTRKVETWIGQVPNLNIKFKVSSVDETEDKNIVNVDIIDVIKTQQGKQIPTPENYLKGEIPNVTPELVEKEVERKLRQNFRQYLGPILGNQNEELVTFKFNHLKK